MSRLFPVAPWPYLEKDCMGGIRPARALGQPGRREFDFQRRHFAIKVHRAINRFSEALDVTYDIRSFASDLVAGSGVPPNRRQEKKWTLEIRHRLVDWTETWVLPQRAVTLSEVDSSLRLYAEGDRLECSL